MNKYCEKYCEKLHSKGNIPAQHTRDLMHSKMASIKLIDTARPALGLGLELALELALGISHVCAVSVCLPLNKILQIYAKYYLLRPEVG